MSLKWRYSGSSAQTAMILSSFSPCLHQMIIRFVYFLLKNTHTSISYLHQDEDVHGVTVLTKCAWNETIVVWVNNR
ncbi:Os02g0704933 [Oryza sativa Japonica Group]|uniref:Os02g0704933 protein n=1 Tax=Oryza sativa subsp. japonica TaxID=39947 RepID=A0A0P0VNF6_ORYSJ|nr:hypothetical protein EE612_013164 [Oryza sativa]BAS80506.1 Os02g0704933 [Oryza sativa Japonica Group]